jgi:hypothetical protein
MRGRTPTHTISAASRHTPGSLGERRRGARPGAGRGPCARGRPARSSGCRIPGRTSTEIPVRSSQPVNWARSVSFSQATYRADDWPAVRFRANQSGASRRNAPDVLPGWRNVDLAQRVDEVGEPLFPAGLGKACRQTSVRRRGVRDQAVRDEPVVRLAQGAAADLVVAGDDVGGAVHDARPLESGHTGLRATRSNPRCPLPLRRPGGTVARDVPPAQSLRASDTYM